MFNPTLKTRLVVDDQEFSFSPHPVVPTLVWGQEGRHAIVYRMQAEGNGRPLLSRNGGNGYALKVFRPAFRHPGLLESAEALSWAHELPGMRVCNQTVITRDSHPTLVEQYEDLDYAMLMPWIDGQTWFDYLQTRTRTTLDQSRALADNMAWVLYALELNQLAHCDLSSGNVIVDPGQDAVHLVDVEDLYSPWLTPPPMVPAGTPGYQHHEVPGTGQWRPAGDRFAGAVLMAEMLGWAHPDVRRAAWGESYFAPEELQQDSERFIILRDVLRKYDAGFAETFEAAWRSRSLETCPPLKSWYDLLDTLPRDPVASWAPLDPREFEGETDVPAGIAVPKLPEPPAVPEQADDSPELKKHILGIFPRSTGCRTLTIVLGVVMLLACYATFLVIEWSLIKDLF